METGHNFFSHKATYLIKIFKEGEKNYERP